MLHIGTVSILVLACRQPWTAQFLSKISKTLSMQPISNELFIPLHSWARIVASCFACFRDCLLSDRENWKSPRGSSMPNALCWRCWANKPRTNSRCFGNARCWLTPRQQSSIILHAFLIELDSLPSVSAWAPSSVPKENADRSSRSSSFCSMT